MDNERLLSEIKDISIKYDSIYRKTGGYFNIFEIASISTKELMICRVISELLSPKGSHYQGVLYLSLFLSIVLKIDITEEELKSARVSLEYVIDEKRRIDIVIQTKYRLIPIEVKIYAKDQKNQCFDYYQKAEKSKLYYLTPYGDNPSEYSTKGTVSSTEGYEGIECISFANDIIEWLDACLRQKETIKLAPIREIILQLSTVIRGFTNQMEDEKEMEVVEKIIESKKMFECALDIEKSLPVAKSRIMKNFFDSLKEEFKISDLMVVDYNENDIKNYYGTKKSNNPCISIVIKNYSEDLKATFSIQVDYKLFFSFEFKNGKNEILETGWVQEKYKKEYELFINTVDALDKENLGEDIMVRELIPSKYTFWGYIKDDENDKVYDFRSFSLPCVNLIDRNDEEVKRICKDYSKKIREIMNTLNLNNQQK
ncbi:MAG: PD-(D/E)XK nuclease family protein [Peptostreptococcaceae bacterium]|nr:PD-(D/E)XK nuclease family protein [Peptostreptococcaceae bacterium]